MVKRITFEEVQINRYNGLARLYARLGSQMDVDRCLAAAAAWTALHLEFTGGK